MISLITHYGLPIVALIIFAGEIGLPTLVPGEIGLLVAGNQTIHSIPMLVGAVLIMGAVDLVATTTIHVAARTGGNRALRSILSRLCSGRRSPEAIVGGYRKRLGGRDSAVVFCTRLIPMLRLYSSIATGLIKVDLRQFLTGAAPAAWLWASIPLTAGYVLRSEMGGPISHYSGITSLIIPVSIALTVILGFGFWQRRRVGAAAAIVRG